MWNMPSIKQLSAIPPLYSTEDVPLKDKVIHQHYFVGGCDWFVAEYSPEERIFFGFACLGDLDCAEWGNISFDELLEIKVNRMFEVDRETAWIPCKAREIPLIAKASGWDRRCPFCAKFFVPVLERPEGDDRCIQEIYPNAPKWQREQLISGCCSDECWSKAFSFAPASGVSQDD